MFVTLSHPTTSLTVEWLPTIGLSRADLRNINS